MEKDTEFVASLPAIVDQLKKCGFVCEGGKLENNAAFCELERIAENRFDVVAACLVNMLDSESIDALEKVLERIQAYNRGSLSLKSGHMNIRIVVEHE